MASDTRISWTGSTWNPWTGCTRVSAGCANCYMFREQKRWGRDPSEVRQTTAHTFNSPLRWQREAERGERTGRQRLVFVCSWSDFFHPDAHRWRLDAWEIIRRCPDLVFQVLTKRPENFVDFLPSDWGVGYQNVWLGVTAENQRTAEGRIPTLLRTPAALRFISCEPLLGPIDLTRLAYGAHRAIDCLSGDVLAVPDADEDRDAEVYAAAPSRIDWVIVGGESGPNARPFKLQWARDLRDQCAQAGVAFFFKQTGENVAESKHAIDRWPMLSDGHKLSRSGSDPSEWPKDLRVQQFPAGWGAEE